MTTDPLTLIQARAIVQSEKADPRQVPNNAGGFTFELDDMARLRRFLTMGTTGGTYYVGERELTKDNAQLVLELARTRGLEVVAEILAISQAGRAPKQNPTLFTLAVCAASTDVETRRAAMAVLPRVARTGTMLFTFAGYLEQFRGWGPTAAKGVANWYTSLPVDKLAYQLIKYRSRGGWTHRDLLRLSHPTSQDIDRRLAFSFAVGKLPEAATLVPSGHPSLRMIEGFLRAQASTSPLLTAGLVEEYGLPWEALIPEHLNEAVVWAALLDGGMPQTALMRNLPKLTTLGLLGTANARRSRDRQTSYTSMVAERLATGMAKAKVHPINVLVALRTYASGQSVRGTGTWHPVPQITDALDAGFYEAFGGVEPSGKRTLLALDVSGSMVSPASGLPLSCRELSAAQAMVTVATEPDVTVVGYTASGGRYGWSQQAVLTPLDISPRRRLDDVTRSISNLPFGGTDCALPWTWALERGLEFDAISSYTDSETWAGTIHPHQAMRKYRERTGIPARSVVVGMTSTGFTVNDPSDPLGLDVAGFDSAVPNLISDFTAGRI